MRNTTAQALAPGVSMVIPITPAITDVERPYILTGLGPGAVSMKVIDDGLATECTKIEITNPTRFVAPFVFFVGPRTFLPPVLSRLARLLGNY